MSNLTLRTDLINKKISIVQNFEVDYNQRLENKDFNNNGTWGKIINPGTTFKSVSFNPNKWKGHDSFAEVMKYMQQELTMLKTVNKDLGV